MSIAQEGDLYIPVCDICSRELPAEFCFFDAVDAKTAAGWRSQEDSFGWADVCLDCQIGDFDS